MSPEIISIIGIILGLAVLIVFALKGVSLYILAPAAAVVVAIFSGGNVVTLMSESYMSSFAGFAQSYFLIFMLSSIFAQVMGDSGVARVIAYKIAGLVRKAPAKHQKFYVLICLSAITSVLTLGGINLYCVTFVLVAIFKDLFEEFDVPWHMYMTSAIGTGGFTMTMVPGTPSIQNLIPIEYLGTDATAGPVLGTVSTIVYLVLSIIYLKIVIGRAEKKKEGFLPTGALIQASDIKDDAEVPDIPLLKCLLPSIALLVALNGFKFSAITSLVIAIVLAVVLFWKEMKHNKVVLTDCFTEGTKNAIMVTATVCVVVGFGGVVAATPGYTTIMNSLDKIPGPPIVQLIIAVNIAAGVAGSASGGLGIGLNLFAEKYLAMGISPEVLHRIAVLSCGGLDTLPHSSGTASALGVAKLTHKQAYYHVFWLNTAIPIVVTILAGALAIMGVC